MLKRMNDRSTDSTFDNDVFHVDPAYSSDGGKKLAKVWERSDYLNEILENEALPDDDAVEFLKLAVRQQIPTAEAHRSVMHLLDERMKDPTLGFFVILFPGEGRDNTGIKDLNDKVLYYQITSKYVDARQKHIDDVFGGDFSVVGQNYKSAYILTLGWLRNEFDKRLVQLDGKLRESLLDFLDEAEEEAEEDDGSRLQEIRKLRRVLRLDKKYRFDIYYGTQSVKLKGDFRRASPLVAMTIAFFGLTESLKAGGIGRYIRKGAKLPRVISRFGKAARRDRGSDTRGKKFKSKEYLKVVSQAGNLKKFITKPFSGDHPYLFNVIWVETVWTRAFFKRRRRFFPNPDVIRAVRKRWLEGPKVKDHNIKVGFNVQKEALELWLVVLNTLDFIKNFLQKEFHNEVLNQHETAIKLLDGLDEKPPKVDWITMKRSLTHDFGPRPVSVLGQASEYIFYSQVANDPEWIFFSMDIRDLGVDLMFLYEDSNEEIEDRKLRGPSLLKETLESTDPIIDRKRFTYDRVVYWFQGVFFQLVRKYRKASINAASSAFGKNVHARTSTPGDSPVAVRIMLGGDEIFVAAHPTFAQYVPIIIKTLHDTPLENGNGEKLNMRTAVAFSKAKHVARPSARAGSATQQRALDEQRDENKRAHQQVLDACDPATKCLKELERQNRRIERLIGLLEANDSKKHLAPSFKERLEKLGLIRLYVQIGYGNPRVLSPRSFQRRIARLASGELSAKEDEHLMDFAGKKIDKANLRSKANKLEADVRNAVGNDNTHIDPPPLEKIPKWLDDILKPSKAKVI